MTEGAEELRACAVDPDALTAWMDDRGLGSGPPTAVHRIGGGTQNVMVRFRRGERSFVLRRGPEHLRRGTNAVLRREVTVLRALAGTAVPHPRLVADCQDESVLGGAVFYLMEPVDGFTASVELPEVWVADAEVRREAGFAMVDALTTLTTVDPTSLGEGFGRPEGFLQRQVPRWTAELQGYTALPGYGGPDIPGLGRTADWLSAHCPATSRTGLMHGDFHLGNVMFAREEPRVVAVVDWEMATIGDPLVDLGWLLALLPRPGEYTDLLGSPLAAAGGLPSHAELVARYEQRTRRPVPDLTWYLVFACFKLGIILEGTYARACAGRAPREVGDRLHDHTLHLFRSAAEFATTPFTS